MTQQVKNDGILQPGVVGLQALDEDSRNVERGPAEGYSGKFRDDITKQVLKDELVKEARLKELAYFESKGVWERCPRALAYQVTGRAPISVRWVDVNEGDDMNPQIGRASCRERV